MKKILITLHLNWYEIAMMEEMMNSLYNAIKFRKLNSIVDFHITYNYQTNFYTPTVSLENIFDEVKSHKIFQEFKIISNEKHDSDSFYCIADYRHETYLKYSEEYDYIVWNEADLIFPEIFFYILDTLDINEPHTLSFSCQKMWDATWIPMEHESIQYISEAWLKENNLKMTHGQHLTEKDVNEINRKYYKKMKIQRLDYQKVDGGLFCLSKGLPTPFIGENHHFFYEDTSAGIKFQYHRIPQFHVSSIIKGHNRDHINKKVNVSRTEQNIENFNREKESSINAFHIFTSKLQK